MCPIDNTCEQLCALKIITSEEVCSCVNGFLRDENMQNCAGEWANVCVCVCLVKKECVDKQMQHD